MVSIARAGLKSSHEILSDLMLSDQCPVVIRKTLDTGVIGPPHQIPDLANAEVRSDRGGHAARVESTDVLRLR